MDRILRFQGPEYWRISFPANLSSPSDPASQTCGAGEPDNLPLLTRAYSPTPACLHLPGFAFRMRKKNTHPGAGRSGIEGKRKRIKVQVMEDALTVVLVIVLCLLLKPLISAILRGMGSSEHRRDR